MAKSGVHRLILADITQSKLKGKALIDALGKMNDETTAKTSKQKNDKPSKKK